MTAPPEVTASTSTPPNHGSPVPSGAARSRFSECVLLFAAAFFVLFLLNSRLVNVYDEGILLTGTMRTMAGQVLYRDFYYIYGPLQLYLFAALFKVFGMSVLVERLADCFSCACTVVSLYVLARTCCRRWIAMAAALLCMVWMVGLMLNQSLMNPALCALILWATWLVIPSREPASQRRRALLAGLLAGLASLFRYDMGLGLVGANLFSALLLLWMRERDLKPALRAFLTQELAPYLATFALTLVPAAIAYLSVAPWHDLLYDVVLYSARYYRLARNLPFPVPALGPRFEDTAVYLLPVLMALGLWAAFRWFLRQRQPARQGMPARERTIAPPLWIGMLVAFAVSAAVMYLKGLVRISAGQVYGSMVPCLLLAAILLERRAELAAVPRLLFAATAILFVWTAGSSARYKLFDGWHLRPIVVNWIVTPRRQPPRPPLTGWCRERTPITRGMCFLLDDAHIQAVEYLDAHTGPKDTLYVGTSHHDRIAANDNVTYFATRRLPATRWSHFDPFLQNRADIQRYMIGDLERNRPPFVVLDSEFENFREPNGSSWSSGVHLLDDYIAQHYAPEKKFGELTILKRR